MTSSEVQPPRKGGPTELVETDEGGYVERLSGGTATLLLAWLIGIGAASALLVFWLWALVLGQRLGVGDLFSGIGFYVAIFGASGPTILWLAGRAQGHGLGWFLFTAVKIGALMAGVVIGIGAVAALLIGGGIGPRAFASAGLLAAGTVVLSMIWALTTWSADWYIARARAGGAK